MDFGKLTAYVDSLPQAGVPGCDLAVCRDHEIIYRHQAGHRDEKGLERVRESDTYCLYSATKVITTCAAMQLIEKGKISLDDPVKCFLPAFEQMQVKTETGLRPAKRAMTIRHLMSMQSGLDYHLDSPALREAIQTLGKDATTRQLMEAKAHDPLEFDPGDNFLYSLSHDVLGAVIEAASGQRFGEYLQEHIFAPLGLATIGFSLSDHSRQSAQYFFNGETQKLEYQAPESNHYRLSPLFESGGAGLISDVDDYIAFADAIACGGEGKTGARILPPEMIQLWSANQLGPRSRKSFDAWNRKGYSYALGVRTRVENTPGSRGMIGEFGWDGAAGAWAMIDPHHRLSAFYAMHVRNFGYSYDVIHPTLRNLIYEALSL